MLTLAHGFAGPCAAVKPPSGCSPLGGHLGLIQQHLGVLAIGPRGVGLRGRHAQRPAARALQAAAAAAAAPAR